MGEGDEEILPGWQGDVYKPLDVRLALLSEGAGICWGGCPLVPNHVV